MLTIWTKSQSHKVLNNLSPVLKNLQDPIRVVQDYSIPEGTKVLLALGSDPLKRLQDLKLVHKNRTVTSLRTTPVLLQGVPVLVSYSPEIGELDYRYYVDLLTDVSLGIRYCNTNTFAPQLGYYQYITSLAPIVEGLQTKYEILGKPLDLMLDLETVGLDPYKLPDVQHPGAYIVTLQLSYLGGEAFAIRFESRKHEEEVLKDPQFRECLNYILNSSQIKVKGANLKYDLHWLWVRGGFTCSNFVFDTTLVGSLLDENRSNSLNVHCKIYAPRIGGYDDEFSRTFNKERMDLIPPDKLLPYACLHGESLVQLDNGTWKKISALVKVKYSGGVKCHTGKSLTTKPVTSWYRTEANQKDWRKIVTSSTREGRWGYCGPAFTPDHEVFIWGGKKRIDFLCPGKDKILTAEFEFSKDQLSVCLGSLLGDGGYTRKNDKKVGFRWGQMVARAEYAEWKANVFSTHFPKELKGSTEHKRWCLPFSSYLAYISKLFPTWESSNHVRRKLKITKAVLDHLGFLGLAVWYMDDGCVEKENGNITGSRIAARCLTTEELGILIPWLIDNFGKGVSYNPNQGFIRFGKTDNTLRRFHNAVSSYACKSVDYKFINPKFDFVVDKQGLPFYEEISKIVSYTPPDNKGGGTRWCLGVEGLHNFVTEVGVVANCGDVDGGLEVSEVLKKELLQDPQLTRFYVTILHPASRAFEKLEQGGVFVDINAYQELKSDLETEQHSLIKKARSIIGGRIYAKHMDQTRLGGLNLKKASMLCDYMFSNMGLNLKPKMVTEKTGEPSTALEHLQMFSDVPEAKEFVSLVSEYASVTKTYDTYVVGFLQHLRSDGRFHPTYYLFVGNKDDDEGGAVTGRLSCKDPAYQTIPKHTKWAKRIRRCFPAPPGYVVVERDYSQGELRVIACISDCKAMIEVYKQNKDLHTKTAATASKMQYEVLAELKKTNEDLYDAIRQKGKAGNFGLVFGMMPAGFVNYARKNYGVEFTLEEATDFRDSFFQEYFELLDYHVEYKAFAHKYGYIRGPLGRVRHLPLINSKNKEMASKAERQSINSPVQMTLTDMVLWTLALEDKAGLSAIAPAFGAVHDAADNYCPEDKVHIIVPQMLEIQQNLPFKTLGWEPQLQFTADAKYGPNLGDLKKFSA